ncbi:hypothetical protein [Klebsiella huaxiensis]|nr:hypothetical protein [Klebsiella huaxiensis]
MAVDALPGLQVSSRLRAGSPDRRFSAASGELRATLSRATKTSQC